MGVRGLKTLVDNNRDLMTRYKLHDSHLVIDGSGLMYFLYSVSASAKKDFRYGGDYVTFGQEIRLFFDNLGQCNVTPIVVLDGGVDPSDVKLRTTVNRQKSRLRSLKVVIYKDVHNEVLIPILAKKVFCDIISLLEIKRVLSLYEADADVALLANHFECPALSNDSDFFVYDLSHGYIPIPSLDSETVRAGGNAIKFKYMDCLRYEMKNLLVKFPQLDRSMLPLFSSIMGNDYVNPCTFSSLFSSIPKSEPKRRGSKMSVNSNGQRQAHMVQLLDWMKGKTVAEATTKLMNQLKRERREVATQLVAMTEKSYQTNVANLDCLLAHLDMRSCPCDHSIDTEFGDNQKVPSWFVHRFLEELLDSQLLDILTSKRVFLKPQTEDFTLETSYACSRQLEGHVIALLRKTSNDTKEILAYDRKLGDLCKFLIPSMEELIDGQILPSLNELPGLTDSAREGLLRTMLLEEQVVGQTLVDMLVCKFAVNEDIAARIDLIITLLNYSTSQPASIVCLEFPLALIACLVHFLVQKESVESEGTLSTGRLDKFKNCPTHNNANPYQPRISHYIAQLQTVILFYNQLNSLLAYPLADVRLDTWLDSVLLYTLTEELRNRRDPQLYVSELLGRDSTFDMLYREISKYVPSVATAERYREKNSRKVTRLPRKRKSELKKRRELSTEVINKFSLLEVDC